MLDTIKYQCFYCRDRLTDENRTRDHLHPKSKGGKLYDDNKVYACRTCNKWKGDLTIEEWLNKLKTLKRNKKTETIWVKRELIMPVLYGLIKNYEMMKPMGEPVVMGEDYCPYCNKLVDMATSTRDNHKPNPKDLSICINCANIMQYGDDMALEKFPEVLFDALDEEQQHELHKIIALIKHVKGQNQPK